jgi:hypothetical protein
VNTNWPGFGSVASHLSALPGVNWLKCLSSSSEWTPKRSARPIAAPTGKSPANTSRSDGMSVWIGIGRWNVIEKSSR